MVVAALAVAILPSVPVFALMALGPWVITQSQQNGAPAAVVIPDFMGPLSLLVDMRRATTPGAKSTVTAMRRFRVGPGSETINFMHTFETFLKDANLNVHVKFTPSGGFNIPNVNFTGGPAGTTFPFSFNQMRTLPHDIYTVKITIQYKNKHGEWDNTPPPPGSPHRFKITSI